MKTIETQVLVIGGGLTGAGILRDLALRGVGAVLVERRDFNAGASGANHGLLHSGGRYAVHDPASAAECAAENAILKRVASGCVEDTGGLFVSVPGDDETYAETFLHACKEVGIAAETLDVRQVLEAEPNLNPEAEVAIRVPDGTINPFMATRANLEDAENHGARVLLNTQVTTMRREGERIVSVGAIRQPRGELVEIHAEQVVSAAGPWVDQIGRLAGLDLHIAYSKGSLLITNARLGNHVINRLRPAADGDIVVPGETVTITGTTSIRVRNLDHLTTSAEEVDLLVSEAAQLVPAMADARYVRVYAGVRPLVSRGATSEDRTLSRTFTLFDHAEDGITNFATIAGGKLTTYRLMAERMTDLVCRRIGVAIPCRTATQPLPGSEGGLHLDPRERLRQIQVAPPEGTVICECEMVGRAQVDAIVDRLQAHDQPISPNAIRLRSRLGMGSCQGGFCGFRTVAHLYERGAVTGREGNQMLTTFLEKRWTGIKPVLWGSQLAQEQILEALYCGTFNYDGDL